MMSLTNRCFAAAFARLSHAGCFVSLRGGLAAVVLGLGLVFGGVQDVVGQGTGGETGAALVVRPGNRLVGAEEAQIGYSDYVRMELVTVPEAVSGGMGQMKMARFDRILDIPGKGYRWDNPGVRIRFRTDATVVKAWLYFNELHASASARNSLGVYLIDGVSKPEWRYETKAKTVKRSVESLGVVMREEAALAAGFHDYELVLPYGDSVDFVGVEVNEGAKFETPKARPATRYLAYGDSITHGFTASSVEKSYAYLVAEKKGWQIVNLGLGGRASNVADAKVAAAQQADVISVFIGVNDWQGGGPVERYRKNLTGFLDSLRATQATVPIYCLTSLWVPPAWNPKGQVAELEAYRQVVREVVAGRKDANLHLIEGLDLIDHDPALFDPVAVHPNDAGFKQMAERLTGLMGE